MKRRTYLAATLAVAARAVVPTSMFALAGCGVSGSRADTTRFAGRTMGTAYRVSLSRRVSAAEEQALRAGVDAVLRRVDMLMSTYRTTSELSLFNGAAAGEPMRIATETATVIAEALRVGSVTGGAFDATVGPLVDLWGFGPSLARGVPSDKAIADASALAGLGQVSVDVSGRVAVKHRAHLRLDLSGVAKGYAVDLVAQYLDAFGFEGYLVDIGGELKARGRKGDGSPWRVGIERPLAGRREVQRIVALEGGAIATSGDYRNFFEHGGRHYSHTIDPRTGRPVQHALASVSVIADRAMTADALATAMMVLGPAEGYALAERLDMPVLFLLRGKEGITERPNRGFTSRRIA